MDDVKNALSRLSQEVSELTGAVSVIERIVTGQDTAQAERFKEVMRINERRDQTISELVGSVGQLVGTVKSHDELAKRVNHDDIAAMRSMCDDHAKNKKRRNKRAIFWSDVAKTGANRLLLVAIALFVVAGAYLLGFDELAHKLAAKL